MPTAARHSPIPKEPPALLAPDEERRLVLEAQRGDVVARDRLVVEFRPLVASVARVYSGAHSIDRTDLMQEGVVGLLRALERFDPAYEVPFWGYAAWWVRQAMQRLVGQLVRPVSMSDRALRQLARVRDARTEHVRACGLEPSSGDLAGATGLSRDHVERLLAVESTPRALDEPLGNDPGGTMTLGEGISDPRSQDEYDGVDTRLEVESRRVSLDGLGERERNVVRARFGLDCPRQTLREIATGLGLSAERVRQIEQHALEELRTLAAAG
jgi:RNA polymerase sigma factor (sigma-70 family)